MGITRNNSQKFLHDLVPKNNTFSSFKKIIRVFSVLTLALIASVLVLTSNTSRKSTAIYFSATNSNNRTESPYDYLRNGRRGKSRHSGLLPLSFYHKFSKKTFTTRSPNYDNNESNAVDITMKRWTPDWQNQTNIKLLLRDRRKRVASVCEKRKGYVAKGMKHAYEGRYHLGKDIRLGLSLQYRLGVCYTPKAGSTYWGQLMRRIIDTSHVVSGHQKWPDRYRATTVDNYFKTVKAWADRRRPWTSLTVVRNPWHRFVSVYIQKQQTAGRERQKFLRNCKPVVRPKNGKVLTFEEFLKCAVVLMENGIFNRHWEPVYRRCDICHHNYTAFVALENMRAESDYILKSIGLKNGADLMDEAREETIRKVEAKKLSQNYTDYYSNLRQPSLITRFADFYKLDFEMFGYPNTPFAIIGN